MSQTYQLLLVSRNTSAAPSSMSSLPHLFSDKMSLYNNVCYFWGCGHHRQYYHSHPWALQLISKIHILNLWINGPISNTIGH